MPLKRGGCFRNGLDALVAGIVGPERMLFWSLGIERVPFPEPFLLRPQVCFWRVSFPIPRGETPGAGVTLKGR